MVDVKETMWWPTPSAEVPNSSSWFNRCEETQPMFLFLKF